MLNFDLSCRTGRQREDGEIIGPLNHDGQAIWTGRDKKPVAGCEWIATRDAAEVTGSGRSRTPTRRSVGAVEQTPRNHLRLNLGGALENIEDAGVAQQA